MHGWVLTATNVYDGSRGTAISLEVFGGEATRKKSAAACRLLMVKMCFLNV